MERGDILPCPRYARRPLGKGHQDLKCADDGEEV